MTAVPHDQLRPGQRVRVTYEATVTIADGRCYGPSDFPFVATDEHDGIPPWYFSVHPSATIEPLPDPKLCALCDHDRRQHDATGCASRDRHGLCVCLKFRRPERTP